jgi:hypothetical protein
MSAGTNYLNHEKGLWSWLTSLDHKRIGLMYLFTIALFFLIGGIFALLVRLELFTPGQTIVGPDKYNQFFTYHGAIMVFMVIIPLIPAAVGNFVLPMMLGAKDVAFPRLNLASYYIFMAGAACAAATLFLRGVDTGWTLYAPYSIRTSTSVVLVVAGAFIMGFSSILTGLNFIVTIHKLRAPGLTWGRLPLFCWAVYATSIIQVLATPVLAITLLLLIAERVLKIGIFDPALGGDRDHLRFKSEVLIEIICRQIEVVDPFFSEAFNSLLAEVLSTARKFYVVIRMLVFLLIFQANVDVEVNGLPAYKILDRDFDEFLNSRVWRVSRDGCFH